MKYLILFFAAALCVTAQSVQTMPAVPQELLGKAAAVSHATPRAHAMAAANNPARVIGDSYELAVSSDSPLTVPPGKFFRVAPIATRLQRRDSCVNRGHLARYGPHRPTYHSRLGGAGHVVQFNGHFAKEQLAYAGSRGALRTGLRDGAKGGVLQRERFSASAQAGFSLRDEIKVKVNRAPSGAHLV